MILASGWIYMDSYTMIVNNIMILLTAINNALLVLDCFDQRADIVLLCNSIKLDVQPPVDRLSISSIKHDIITILIACVVSKWMGCHLTFEHVGHQYETCLIEWINICGVCTFQFQSDIQARYGPWLLTITDLQYFFEDSVLDCVV